MSIANIKKFVTSLNSGSKPESLGKTLENIGASLKSMPSILAKDLNVNGEISSSGIIEVEGKINGTIKGNLVVIREDGLVYGEVIADYANIYGHFEGTIKAKNVNIFKKAKIFGTIEYHTLSVEDGACIDGQFKQIAGKINN